MSVFGETDEDEESQFESDFSKSNFDSIGANVKLVRYESIKEDLLRVIEECLDFCGLRCIEKLKKCIETEMKKGGGGTRGGTEKRMRMNDKELDLNLNEDENNRLNYLKFHLHASVNEVNGPTSDFNRYRMPLNPLQVTFKEICLFLDYPVHWN